MFYFAILFSFHLKYINAKRPIYCTDLEICAMFCKHYRSLFVHKSLLHIHFRAQNKHEKDGKKNIECHVVQLCIFMSYNYRCSCCTFIAPHVVQHGNLIKTGFQKGPKNVICSSADMRFLCGKSTSDVR